MINKFKKSFIESEMGKEIKALIHSPDAEEDVTAYTKSQNADPQIIRRRSFDSSHDNDLQEFKAESVDSDDEKQNFALQGDSLEKIRQAHKKNNPETNQCKDSSDFMHKVMYSVPLNQLYEVVASCNYDEKSNFCPVLIRIVDEKIKSFNPGKHYLVQVWTREGQIIFERAMSMPISNWNITKDKFLFQETANSPEVFLLQLYMDKTPILFKFKFSENVTAGRINSVFEDGQFVIPDEDQTASLEEHKISQVNLTMMQNTAMDQSDEKVNASPRSYVSDHSQNTITNHNVVKVHPNDQDGQPPSQGKSVSQLFSRKIIKRAPDKMIDYKEGFILLGFRSALIYLNVSPYIDDDFCRLESGKDLLRTKPQDYVIELKEDEISFMDLDKGSYKIICFQEIGHETSAVVVESLIDRQLHFLRISQKHEDDNNSSPGGKIKLKLVQLGLLINKSKVEKTPVLKYRAVAKFDPKTQKSYHVGLVVRESGRLEVYADFMLVYEYMNPELQCVDIETDFNQFYFKMVTDSHKVTHVSVPSKMQFQIRQVRHFWRNRISFETSKIKGINTWNQVIHRRVANFVQLYTQVTNFSTYMLVAHRNMISVYNMQDNSDNNWMDTIEFPSRQGHIRKMFIKKRPKNDRENIRRRTVTQETHGQENITAKQDLSVYKKYQIVCLVGSQDVKYCSLSHEGQLAWRKDLFESPGRILRFSNDEEFNMGVLLLTDSTVKMAEFKKQDGCLLYNFPLLREPGEDQTLVLYALKMQKLYPILASQEKDNLPLLPVSQCLARDSFFRVLRANRNVFERPLDQFEQELAADQEEEDEVKRAFPLKTYCNVLACSSQTNQVAIMFPLVKERFIKSKNVKSIHIITNEKHKKEIKMNQHDHSARLNAFFLNSREFGDDIDSFVTVTQNYLRLYDSNMDMSKTFSGLNIRSCLNIHQSYLYTISNAIMVPYKIKDDTQGEDSPAEKPAHWQYSASGFYVYDISRLFQGKVEKYKLAAAIGGVCSHIDNSKFSDRISFIQNYDKIAVIPYAHINLINCVGMGNKHEYLIWREKNGFFTALDQHRNLQTWSLITGKFLYNEEQSAAISQDEMENFKVYQADENDVTYTRNFYNFENESLSLLQGTRPITDQIKLDQSQHINFHNLVKKLGDQSRMVQMNGTRLDQDIFTSSNAHASIMVKNADKKVDMYQFMVISLKVHEDTKSQSQCDLKFKFLFPKLRKKPTIVGADKKVDYEDEQESIQHLYLSRDTTKLMEVIDNQVASIYYRVDVNRELNQASGAEANQDQNRQEDNGQEVEWIIKDRIRSFPRLLAQSTSVPYMFSPNFKFQIDLDYRSKQLHIIKVKTQEVYLKIPSDLINTLWNGVAGIYSLAMIFSRIKWESDFINENEEEKPSPGKKGDAVDDFLQRKRHLKRRQERTLRIVTYNNLDCIFEMHDPNPKDQSPQAFEQRYLKLISVSKLDNLFLNRIKLDSPHLLCQPFSLENRDALERLIRTNQQYKTSLQHAINLGKKDFNLLQMINKIDYSQPWGHFMSSFDVELSFTWLDWLIMEQAIYEPNFDLREIDPEQKIQACFNIFPSGQGILHHLAQNRELNNISGADLHMEESQSYFPTRDIFDVASQKIKLFLTGEGNEGSSFEIPILQDIYGQTALDICLGIENKKNQDEQIFKMKEANQFQVEEKVKNLIMADLIFDQIKEYGLLHSSQQIVRALIEAIKIGLPSVKDYLDHRMVKIDHPSLAASQSFIKQDRMRNCPAMGGDYGILYAQVFSPISNLKKNLFNPETPQQPMNLFHVDLPEVYDRTKAGKNIINALAGCTDLEFFELKSIQVIIDCHAEYWDRINWLFLGLPMIFQLVVFWYWSNFALPHLSEGEGELETTNTMCRVLLSFTSAMLIFIEVSSIIKLREKYLKAPTQLFNIITPTLIMINVIQNNYDETSFWTVQSWAALVVWFRFLLYLRTVKRFSWLMRMITECIAGMFNFLIVLIIGVIAFTDAFESIDQILILNGSIERADKEQDIEFYDRYLQPYFKAWQKSFFVALGEFDTDNLELYREIDWFIFFLCCIFNIILLLNLLIAIISETYANVSMVKVATTYREKTIQIKHMQDSIFGYFSRNQPDHTELALVAQVISSAQMKQVEEEDMESVVEHHVAELGERMDAMEDRLTEYMEQSMQRLAMFFMTREKQGADGDSTDQFQKDVAATIQLQKSFSLRQKSHVANKQKQKASKAMRGEIMVKMSKLQQQVNTNKQQPQMPSVAEEDEFVLDELVLGGQTSVQNTRSLQELQQRKKKR